MKKYNQGFSLIALIIIVLVVVIICGGTYYYFNKSNLIKNINQSNNQASQNLTPANENMANLQWSEEAHDASGNIILLCDRQREEGEDGNCDTSGSSSIGSSAKSVGYINGQGAVAYCKNLNEGGYGDWRLPAVNELTYAYNVGKSAGFLPSSFSYFPYSSEKPVSLNSFHADLNYWSSTIDKNGSGNIYYVGFERGDTPAGSWDNDFAVRCVRL